MPVTTADRTTAHVADLVTPLLSDTTMALYDVEMAGQTLRILIEGAGIDELESVSRRISDMLDEADEELLPERFYLEVSSPGLERPLRRPEHFAAAVGTKVKLKTASGVEGDRRVQDTLETSDAEGITIGGRRLAYGEIEQARTVFEWGTPSKAAPSKGPAKARPAGARTRRAS